MTFVSYAQNYEDVMLHRALKDVGKGFYIDVGANDPVQDSVTKAFYDRGWRGINIEPVEAWYQQLVKDRPEDINLKVAVTDEPGILKLFDIAGTGLATSSAAVAESHREGGFETQELFVPALTLESICRSYAVGDIHFLKIDVEGAEKQVLAGIALETYRPWIIVVEATAPLSSTQTHQDWTPLLAGRGYDQVYFDGLNQFYVARERAELTEAFRVPPNFFDGFVRHELVVVRDRLTESQAELARTSSRVEEMRGYGARVEAELARANGHAEELREYGTRVEAELARANGHAEELRAYGARVEAELARANGQVEELREYGARVEAELARANSQVEELREYGVRVEAELARTRSHAEARIELELNQARENAAALESEVARVRADLEAKAADLSAQSQHWWTVADGLNHTLQSVYASRSWRLTTPVRLCSHVLRISCVRARAWLTLAPGSLPHRAAGASIRRLGWWILSKPRLAHDLNRWLMRFPAVRHRLRQVVTGAPPIAVRSQGPIVYYAGREDTHAAPPHVEVPPGLGPAAGRVYGDLRRTLAR